MTHIFPELPHTLGVYSLTRLLEVRNNTELYEAQHTHVNRTVVLEVLQPGVPREEESAFLLQAQHRGASSGTPHVANVFESLRADGIWFLTMERPHGQSLADHVAANSPLSVTDICRVISAAAEMYNSYAQAGHTALPMAPPSIYIEKSGKAHFLSPLVEGKSVTPQEQMQAMAATLWSVCPQETAPGLGRTTTLLQWLQNGVDGTFLSWQELKQTADTIISQLQTSNAPMRKKSIMTRICEQVDKNPKAQRIRTFLAQWGVHIAASAGVIVLLSSIGGIIGSSDPIVFPACGTNDIYCQANGVNERVLRQLVSVQQYADFMQQFEAMSEEARQAMLQDMAEMDISLEPAGWNEQAQNSADTPVTGVSYWQALLYARSIGAMLPTANQLQAIRAEIPGKAELEWTRSEAESPVPGIYDGTAYLLVDKSGNIIPSGTRDWKDAKCCFRVAFPCK